MTRTKIQADKAPAAVGPYSHAIVANGFVFCSGQAALDPATGKLINGDVQAQTRQTLENLRAVLRAAGTDLDHVVKTTVFLTDMSHFPMMNLVYASYFGGEQPARSTVAVKELPLGAIVEIEAVAVLPE